MMGNVNNYNLIYEAAREAARTGNDNKLKEHIKSGIDIDSLDSHGDTPLKNALSWRYTKAATMLLEYGANPNQIDKYGNVLIHDAVRYNSIEGVKLLVKYGADIKAVNKYRNSDASPEMINLLIELGVKPRENVLTRLAELFIANKYYASLIKVLEEFNKAKEIK